MSKHLIKIDPEYYKAVVNGSKTFEYRVNDRDYKTGDLVIMREYDREKDLFTGKSISFYCGFILYSPAFGLPENTCVISINHIGHSEK